MEKLFMMKEYRIVSTIKVYEWDELSEEDRELVSAAKQATNGSYAPYSQFRVGAAARLANGIIFTGSNQENAAYPSGLCAERTTLFAANAQYPDAPVLSLAIAARKGDEFLSHPISPCGACRQVISGVVDRYNQPMKILLYGTRGVHVVRDIAGLLPLRFVDADLK